MSILNNYLSNSIVSLRNKNKYELCLFKHLPFIFPCTILVELSFWKSLTCDDFSKKRYVYTKISLKYETREVSYLVALHFCRHFIILLLPIFIFIPLALWHYLSLVQSTVKIFGLRLAMFLFLNERTITLMVSCSGRALFCFILFCQSIGIGFKISA